MNWSKRVGRLMKTKNKWESIVDRCIEMNLAPLGCAALKEVDKCEAKLIRLIEPRLKGETVEAISQSDIDRAREHPIENLLDVKKGKCLCPFHNDRNPSATIKNNKLTSWSQCGRTFDVIDVYRKLHGVSFTDSVKALR